MTNVQKIKNYNESMLESMSNGVITLDERDIIVTCNSAGARIFKLAPLAILGLSAAEFFAGKNAWIIERIKKVQLKEKVANVAMDLEIALGDRPVSVNLTVLPLASGDGKQLGTLLMIEDISTEKRVKATMARYMDRRLPRVCSTTTATLASLARRQPGDRPILGYPGLHHIERGAGRTGHSRLAQRVFHVDGRLHRSARKACSTNSSATPSWRRSGYRSPMTTTPIARFVQPLP